MKIEEEKTIIETKRICDFCKDNPNQTYKSCSGCSKDICVDCIKSWDYQHSEDYPDKYCDKCTKIRDKYKEKISTLNSEIYDLEEKCKKECSQSD